MYALRAAEPADQKAIWRLIRQARINPTGIHWQRFVVAVDRTGRVIGCGQVKQHRDGSSELASIAVLPEHRRQGIASSIIIALLSQHPHELYLLCRSSLGPFYERFGFQVIGPAEMPAYFKRINRLAGWVRRLDQQGESLLVMRKPG